MKQRTLINQKRVRCLSFRTVLLNQDICEDIKRKSLLCDLSPSLVNTLNGYIKILTYIYIFFSVYLFECNFIYLFLLRGLDSCPVLIGLQQ